MVRRAFLAFLVCGLVACGDDGTGLENITGTYVLQTVNGEGPPFSEIFGTGPEVGTTEFSQGTGGHIVLGPESSCEVGLTFETSVLDQFGRLAGAPSSTTVTDPCTFVFSNGVLTLNYADGKVETGSIAGSTLTLTRGGSVWVFQK